MTRPAARGGFTRGTAGGRAKGPRAAIDSIVVRRMWGADLDQVIAIDGTVTGLEKRSYWQSVSRRYGNSGPAGREFLVADADGAEIAKRRRRQHAPAALTLQLPLPAILPNLDVTSLL
jgi:hypothetical protein